MSDPKAHELLQQRADEADKLIKVLTKKVEELELANKKDRKDAHTVSSGAASNEDSAAVTVQLTEARKENKALKAEITKLNYRISHLLKSLDEEEKKNKAQ